MRSTRLIILSFCAVLALTAIVSRSRLRNSLHRFWSAPGSPITLAVFRIVLFGTLFLSVDVTATIWYSRVPAELRIGFFGIHRLLPQLLITPALAAMSARLLLVFSALATIGFFTRTSAWLSVVFGLYVLGIPHLYGKVNHLHHHLIWFAALMAVSPCADVLSCDSLIRAWQRADAGNTAPPGDARKYALPLRFVWLLMGVIYFFPGFWKLWNLGPSWASSQNLRAQMYSKWMEFDGWTPTIRIDHYPAFCTLVGIATIAFEITFLFLVFFPRARPWLIIAGLAFHNLTNLFMRIVFAPLQAMYASLVDWRRVFQWLGRRLYPAQLSVAYDARSPTIRRLISALRVSDVFGRITYSDSRCEFASQDAPRQIVVQIEQSDGAKRVKRLTNLPACRAIAARLPILWPTLPFLFLMPKQTARCFARLCEDEARPQAPLGVCAVPSIRPANNRISSAAIIGTVLLLVNVAFGVRRKTDAWPFACYPTFDFQASERCDALTVAVQQEGGQIVELNRSGLSPNLTADRARGLQKALMTTRDPEVRDRRLRALWELWQQNHPELGDVRAVWFYRDTLTTVPEDRARNPLQRELLLALPQPRMQKTR